MPLLSDQMKARIKDLNKIKASYNESISKFNEIADNNAQIIDKARLSKNDDLKKSGEACFKITAEYLLLTTMIEFLAKNYEEALFMNTAMATYIGGTSQEKEFADFFQIYLKESKPKSKSKINKSSNIIEINKKKKPKTD